MLFLRKKISSIGKDEFNFYRSKSTSNIKESINIRNFAERRANFINKPSSNNSDKATGRNSSFQFKDLPKVNILFSFYFSIWVLNILCQAKMKEIMKLKKYASILETNVAPLIKDLPLQEKLLLRKMIKVFLFVKRILQKKKVIFEK